MFQQRSGHTIAEKIVASANEGREGGARFTYRDSMRDVNGTVLPCESETDGNKDAVENATCLQEGNQSDGANEHNPAPNVLGVAAGGGKKGKGGEKENCDTEFEKETEPGEEGCLNEALDSGWTVEAAKMDLDRLLDEIETQRRNSASLMDTWTQLVQNRKHAVGQAVGVVSALENTAKALQLELDAVHLRLDTAYHERDSTEVSRLSHEMVSLMEKQKSAQAAADKAKEELKDLDPGAATAGVQSEVCKQQFVCGCVCCSFFMCCITFCCVNVCIVILVSRLTHRNKK